MITSEAQNILDEHQHEWHEIVNGEDRLGTAKFRVDIEKLARDGHVYAQLHLANHLAVGAAGYSVDLAAAKRWLSKASNSGEGRALYDLARFCEKNGTPDEAFKILYSLVESRYLPAFYRLGTYYAKGFGCRST